MTANESKAGIKKANQRPAYLRIDDVPAGLTGGKYNIYTGDNS